MATIALYAGKINQMPSLISDVRKSVDAYSSELFSMKSKALNIRRSVCDLDDVLGMYRLPHSFRSGSQNRWMLSAGKQKNLRRMSCGQTKTRRH